ncbi:MAG: hypothetical protein ACI86M_004056, partial [Saprospiraceae bacterium]
MVAIGMMNIDWDFCSEFVVLAHSIQLIHDKRTLGELDYIIQNVDTKEVLHIELT